MNHVKINYLGAQLEMPDWLADMWPHDLPLNKWPSYCGAGRGIGDWLVPEYLYDANVSPECFIHDIDWIVAPDTYWGFQSCNNRFLRNLNSSCKAQLSGRQYLLSKIGCLRYWFFVSTVGLRHFNPSYVLDTYPADNTEIREKLHRLAMARLNTV